MQKWENVLLHFAPNIPPPSHPSSFFLLAPEEVLSFKLKYWQICFN